MRNNNKPNNQENSITVPIKKPSIDWYSTHIKWFKSICHFLLFCFIPERYSVFKFCQLFLFNTNYLKQSIDQSIYINQDFFLLKTINQISIKKKIKSNFKCIIINSSIKINIHSILWCDYSLCSFLSNLNCLEFLQQQAFLPSYLVILCPILYLLGTHLLLLLTMFL